MKTLGTIALFFALIIFALMVVLPVKHIKSGAESGELVK